MNVDTISSALKILAAQQEGKSLFAGENPANNAVNTTAATEAPAKKDKPKAKLWANIGKFADVTLQGEETPRFISAFGIPLDAGGIRELKGNSVTRALIKAGNAMLLEVIEDADAIPSGECVYVGKPGDAFVIEFRKVNDEEARTPEGTDLFARPANTPRQNMFAGAF